MPSKAATTVIQVAVPAPLRRVFDYRCAAPAPVPGARVRVPFGRGERGRELLGVALSNRPAEAGRRLKRVAEVLDDDNLFGARVLQLITWAARYYHHPLGEALQAALPAEMRRGRPLADPDGVWCARVVGDGDGDGDGDGEGHGGGDIHPRHPRSLLSGGGDGEGHGECHGDGDGDGEGHAESAAAQLHRAPAQRRLYDELQGRGWVEVSALGEHRDALRRLRERGLAEVAWRTPPGDGGDGDGGDGDGDAPPVTLNPQQQAAVDAIVGGGDGDGFASYLLHGITGSGKTEVYLEAARRVICGGRQVLILVPEIALTPQLVARVRARLGGLGGGLSVLHSGLTDERRYRAWWRARAGLVGAVLGTRSAIFTPLKSPGLIIVDEEHDISYKQQGGFRYHARDLAIKRASLEGVPVALGSATPSMETRHNAATGRHRRLALDHRGGSAQLPRVAFIDAKRHRPTDGLSAPLLRAIDARLTRGEQCIIFLNRRGFAPLAQCNECGWQAVCERCDARLTYHRERGRPTERGRDGDGDRGRDGDGDRGRDGDNANRDQFRCHHCGRISPAIDECPGCRARLLLVGAGTQRIERRLRERFPEANISRLDRDRVRSQAQLEAALRAIRDGHADIIIGTQLIAKGHDFARVTLVGVVNADQGLYSADFRAPEYLFQQLTQVSGRAGRASAAGEVLVQTAHPNHPTLQTMRRHDFEQFARQCIDERRLADCPPFARLALWRAESTAPGAAVAFLAHVARLGRGLARGRFDAVQIMHAVASPMEKRAGRYRAQLLVKSPSRAPLHGLLDEWLSAVETDRKSRTARWSIDVDPMEMF